MKYIVEQVYAHQAAVLWFSLAFIVSMTAFVLVEAFKHLP